MNHLLEPEDQNAVESPGRNAGVQTLMQKRRQVQQTSSLEERIAARIRTFKAVAETLPPGSKERERLEQKVKVHTDAFAQVEGWLNSVGLQRPK